MWIKVRRETGVCVVELEVPKVTGSAILKNKDRILIFRIYA